MSHAPVRGARLAGAAKTASAPAPRRTTGRRLRIATSNGHRDRRWRGFRVSDLLRCLVGFFRKIADMIALEVLAAVQADPAVILLHILVDVRVRRTADRLVPRVTLTVRPGHTIQVVNLST